VRDEAITVVSNSSDFNVKRAVLSLNNATNHPLTIHDHGGLKTQQAIVWHLECLTVLKLQLSMQPILPAHTVLRRPGQHRAQKAWATLERCISRQHLALSQLIAVCLRLFGASDCITNRGRCVCSECDVLLASLLNLRRLLPRMTTYLTYGISWRKPTRSAQTQQGSMRHS